jgi:hypothetical protein
LRCDIICVLAEILLIYNAVFIDDESHHAGRTILRRECDQREATRQSSIDNVVFRSTGRVRSLSSQVL